MIRLLPLLFLFLLTGCEQYKRMTGQNYKDDEGNYQAPGTPEVSPQPPAPPPEPPITPAPVEPTETVAVILAGQSNADELVGQTFVEEMNKRDSSKHYVLVDTHEGGSAISRWAPGVELYQRMSERISQAGYPVAVFLWAQGETDAIPCNQSWGNEFTQIVQGVRLSYGSNVPVIYAQLGQPFNNPANTEWECLKDIQASLVIPNSHMVKTDDLPVNSSDGIHFLPESYREIGRRMANVYP